MNDSRTETRLQRHLATMVALEGTIARQVRMLADRAFLTSTAVSLLASLRELNSKHEQVLADRLRLIAPEAALPAPVSTASALFAFYDTANSPDSAALLAMLSLLDQAVAGYALLMVLARRAADSSVRGPENTDDIVQDHLQGYVALAGDVVRALPGVLVAELEHDGQECQCTCPSCGMGICLCAVSTRRMLALAQADAGPIYAPDGVTMVLPRAGSAAQRAGLQKGDVLLAVDGETIESIVTLQQAIRGHQSGEEIHFQVRRESGEAVALKAVCP